MIEFGVNDGCGSDTSCGGINVRMDTTKLSNMVIATQLNSTENYGCRCLTLLCPHRYNLTIINEHYHFMTSSDRIPVPVRSAVKSNLAAWCCQNLSKRALNVLTVLASVNS